MKKDYKIKELFNLKAIKEKTKLKENTLVMQKSAITKHKIIELSFKDKIYTSQYIVLEVKKEFKIYEDFLKIIMLNKNKELFNLRNSTYVFNLKIKDIENLNIHIEEFKENTNYIKISDKIRLIEEYVKIKEKKFKYIQQELLSGRVRIRG